MPEALLRLLRPLVWRLLSAFERRHRYDASHLRHLFDASPRAFLDFNRVMQVVATPRTVPADCWHAARFAATRHEGCDACAQLMLEMAAQAGVAPRVLQALLDEDPSAMSDEAALGWRYARAVLAHDPAAADHAEAIAARQGRAALAHLALGVVFAHAHPTLKYALGMAPSCQALALPQARR